MATPILTNIWKVAFNWTNGGQHAANVFGVSSPAATAAALHTTINTNVTTAMWQGVASGARITSVSYFKLDGQTPTTEITTVGTNWDGSASTADNDPAVAGILTLTTAERGPHARGRLYLPFVHSASTTNGFYDAPVAAALDTAWNTFRTSMSAGGAPLQVVSFGNLQVVPAPPIVRPPAARPVVALRFQQALATQRRRQTRIRG